MRSAHGAAVSDVEYRLVGAQRQAGRPGKGGGRADAVGVACGGAACQRRHGARAEIQRAQAVTAARRLADVEHGASRRGGERVRAAKEGCRAGAVGEALRRGAAAAAAAAAGHCRHACVREAHRADIVVDLIRDVEAPAREREAVGRAHPSTCADTVGSAAAGIAAAAQQRPAAAAARKGCYHGGGRAQMHSAHARAAPVGNVHRVAAAVKGKAGRVGEGGGGAGAIGGARAAAAGDQGHSPRTVDAREPLVPRVGDEENIVAKVGERHWRTEAARRQRGRGQRGERQRAHVIDEPARALGDVERRRGEGRGQAA